MYNRQAIPHFLVFTSSPREIWSLMPWWVFIIKITTKLSYQGVDKFKFCGRNCRKTLSWKFGAKGLVRDGVWYFFTKIMYFRSTFRGKNVKYYEVSRDPGFNRIHCISLGIQVYYSALCSEVICYFYRIYKYNKEIYESCNKHRTNFEQVVYIII